MKKVISYVLLLTVIGLLGVSCSKDTVAASCNTTVTALSKTFTDATTAYFADPTSSAKCSAFKAAGTALISGIKGCPGYDQASATAAQTAIDAVTCP